MDGDDEGVQVSVESSWTVLKGSLESCVSVVFLDPDTHEPIISSSPHCSTKLVLVPPAEPVPCEVTVKFQGRLCHVQSLYTSSTARICELYSRSNLETDREYVCTVKGWIPGKDDSPSNNGTEINLEEEPTMKRSDEVLVKGSDCSDDGVHEGVISGVVSLRTLSNHVVDDECQKSVCSSGEDSWVNVKMNGSSSVESACVSLTAPDLDNWHVPLNAEELVHLEDQLSMASLGLEAEQKGLENAEGKAPIEQDIFEAEVELVDHDPWAAITIRLLSLQDKSAVEVDQMVFLAISGPVAEPAASAHYSDGKEPTSALFAMFLPSILQMARGVSGKSKDLSNSEISRQPCEEKQYMMDVAHAGQEEVCQAYSQCALDNMPVWENNMPCPSSVDRVADCAFSDTSLSAKLEVDQSSVQELEADGDVSKRTKELDVEALQPGLKYNPVCNCKGFAEDAIANKVATTFDAFSERFDRLESMCLRIESFLHKTFESLDQRITCLEAQKVKDSGETDSINKHSGTLSDAQTNNQVHLKASESKEEVLTASAESAVQDDFEMQHQNSNQVHPRASSPHKSESNEEAPSASTNLFVKEHSEVQHVFKEALHANALDFSLADIELVKDAPSMIQELSSEPEIVVGNKAFKENESHVSLDDAWASALSAFASSFPSVVADTKLTIASLADEQLLGSSHSGGSVSRSHDPEGLKEEGNGLSSSSHLEFRSATPFTKGVDIKAVNSGLFPADGVCEGATSDDKLLIALKGPGSTLPSRSTTLEPAMSFDSLDLLDILDRNSLKEMQSTSQDLDGDMAPSQVNAQQDAQPSSPQFDLFSSAHSNTMLFGETFDNWAALGGLKTRSSPLLRSSLIESQDAALKQPPHNMCNANGDGQEKVTLDLLGGDLEYDFLQQRPLVSSLYAESGTSPADKSEEECLCNATLELDFLSGRILSEQGEGSSITEIQDPQLSLRSFTCCTTEEVNGFPEHLEEDSSNYQDGMACSEDSLCFSQDFDACPNDSSNTRWTCAPNIFYMHDPELTDDEADNTAGGLDERTETSDSILQDDFSDTDSTQDSPFWSARNNAKKNEQPSVAIFPGFENLC